ncbi:hypothetical protein QYF36_005104 [Acer negundo]|nr:hypothetical protein QYF36_005104 [Acer negundo]
MSNSLNHPDVFKKARAEIQSVLDLDQLMDELDLSKLHYLQNIILETIRLYPTDPLMVPHLSSDDCMGQRACLGKGMAQCVLGLTLGLLIQCFHWKRVDDKEVDMRDGKGLTMPKVVSLEAMCKARPIFNKAFSKVVAAV